MLSAPNRAILAEVMDSAWLGAELAGDRRASIPIATLERVLQRARADGPDVGHPEAVTLNLPFPPSANSLHRSVNGRSIISKPYREWRRAVALSLLPQLRRWTHRPIIAGPYSISVTAERPDARARDLDNLCKSCFDSLTAPRKNKPGAHVVEDDSLAQRVTLQWAASAPKKGARVIVVLTPWSVNGVA